MRICLIIALSYCPIYSAVNAAKSGSNGGNQVRSENCCTGQPIQMYNARLRMVVVVVVVQGQD